jgi:hypothetical protein
MAVPVGMWNLVTDLNNNVLNITNVDGQGNLTGTIQVDASDTYPITGTWSATNQFNIAYVLNFSYRIPFNFRNLRLFTLLSFQGYHFQAGMPLFDASPGSVSAAWDMLAGTYTVAGFDVILGGFISGWVARSVNQI